MTESLPQRTPKSNVTHLPQHRQRGTPTETPGKHRADDETALSFIVKDCRDVKLAIDANPSSPKTRNYLIEKANEFGCGLDIIPKSWYL